MRDGRLEFQKDSVRLLPGNGDSDEGVFPIDEESTRYDVVIVGSGISGLSSAFFLSRKNPGIRILFLDANSSWGGNAAIDAHSPIPVPASTGAAYGVAPYTDFLKEIYQETGVIG